MADTQLVGFCAKEGTRCWWGLEADGKVRMRQIPWQAPAPNVCIAVNRCLLPGHSPKPALSVGGVGAFYLFT